MTIIMKPTNNFDIAQLALVMRREDRQEVYAATGKGPLEALQEANEVSCDTFTAWADGHVLCGLGIRPGSLVRGGIASPWFLSSVYLPGHTRELLVLSRRAIIVWLAEYEVLVNYVDARYNKSLRWLRKLGFVIHDPMPYGYLGLPFHRVEIRRN
jgi:hypothetical protein